MGWILITTADGRFKEFSRWALPAQYDSAIHTLLESDTPPPEKTYWTGTAWVPLPPKTDTEKDTELQTFLDSSGGLAIKSIATVLIQKGVLTLADIKTAYRSLRT